MCGIVGYLGKKSVVPVILDSLQTLEYRGYDSAGVAFIENNELNIYKASGKLQNLRNQIPAQWFEANGTHLHLGMGHTRWATHGAPTDSNAHPHVSQDNRIALVHNGIIENYGELRETLIAKGYAFQSKTDSECVVHLLSEILKNQPDFSLALQQLTQQLVGAYALVIIDKQQPSKLYGIRNHAPLVVGVGENEMLIGSDVVALIEHTNKVSYLNDGEIVELSADGFKVITFNGQTVESPVEVIPSNQLIIDKKGYKHFMLKEIYEQPDVIRNSLSGRLITPDEPIALLDAQEIQRLDHINRVFVVACGTSFHAGLVGKYFIESTVGLPVEVDSAGEFRYRNPLVDDKTLVIAISQSGETADTLSAIRQSKEKGATVIAVTNREDSTIARESHIVLPVRAGIEVSVCATKSFTAQVIVLVLLALQLAETKQSMTDEALKYHKTELQRLPTLVDQVLHNSGDIQALAKKYGNARDMIFIARGMNFPAALEGALKLKEVSYIHAEGYSASELKHGPIAMLDQSMPVVAILAPGVVYDKMISNCQEAKARDAQVIAINCGPMPEDVKDTFTDVIFVPETAERLSPILTSIPLQLFAYYIAEYLGKDVDQPRNLAKSVTVE